MAGVNWFVAGVIGLLAGLLAERALSRHFSIFGKLAAGLGGAVAAGFLADWLQIQMAPGLFTVTLLSLIGATFVLALASLFRKPR